MRTIAAVLALVTVEAGVAEEPVKVRAAIEKGLNRIRTGAARYIETKQCFSCHHQTTALRVLAAARQRGFADLDADWKQQRDFTLDYLLPRQQQLLAGQGLGGGNTMAGFALAALEAAQHPPDATTEALVAYVLKRQRPDGFWPAVTSRRGPTEGSPFTNAALILRGLKTYRPRNDASARRVDAAIERATLWLRNTPAPIDREGQTSRLIALGLIGAKAEVASARDALLKAQAPDGGWSQMPGDDSDAYATATSMLALRTAGLSPQDEAYQRGIRFLLKRQRDDGAWIVATRAEPVQKFFDNGDPGGRSQFLSFTATGLATLALLETEAMR